MRKTSCLAALVVATWAVPAFADESTEFPLTTPAYPFQRSALSGEAVVIAPYRHRFSIRIYTTPQQAPYYNIPSYAVVAPY